MKAVVSLGIGLAMGAALTVVGMSYAKRGVAPSEAMMALFGAKMGAMHQSVKAERCSDSDFAPHLRILQALGEDLEPAFLPTMDDVLFSKHGADFRAMVDESMTRLPNTCEAASQMLNEIGATCKSCHQDFKN